MADIVPVTNRSLMMRGKVVSTPASYVAPGRPRYPRDISAAGRKVFKRLCKLLEERRTLTDADGDLIRLYCIAHARHARAIEHLEAQGEIVTRTVVKDGEAYEVEKTNLWLGVATKAEAQMLSILDRLGLTPGSRDKVKVTKGCSDDFIEISLSKNNATPEPSVPALPPAVTDATQP
jgi:P27 family predicted phage terminase small subunit